MLIACAASMVDARTAFRNSIFEPVLSHARLHMPSCLKTNRIDGRNCRRYQSLMCVKVSHILARAIVALALLLGTIPHSHAMTDALSAGSEFSANAHSHDDDVDIGHHNHDGEDSHPKSGHSHGYPAGDHVHDQPHESAIGAVEADRPERGSWELPDSDDVRSIRLPGLDRPPRGRFLL